MEPILSDDQKTKIVEAVTSVSRAMAFVMVLQYAIVASWLAYKTNTFVPMPWENMIATVVFYAIGKYTPEVLDFLRDVIPWAKARSNASA